VPPIVVKQASDPLVNCIHAIATEVGSGILQGLCYNSTSYLAFPGWRRRQYGDLDSRRTVTFCFV